MARRTAMLRSVNVWLLATCVAALGCALPARSHASTGANGVFLVRLDFPDPAGQLGLRTDLFLLNGSGAIVQRLTNDSAWEYGARLTRDGQTVVFSSDRSGNPEIYTMRADGTQ